MENSGRKILGYKSRLSVAGDSIRKLIFGLAITFLLVIAFFVFRMLGRIPLLVVILTPLVFIVTIVSFFATSYVEYDGNTMFIRHLFWPGERSIRFLDITKVKKEIQVKSIGKNKSESTTETVWTLFANGKEEEASWFSNASYGEVDKLLNTIRRANPNLEYEQNANFQATSTSSTASNASDNEPPPIMVKCPNCGAENTSNLDFCKSCGHAL
jgi:hypothetical protein